jgi:hypothetical protein
LEVPSRRRDLVSHKPWSAGQKCQDREPILPLFLFSNGKNNPCTVCQSREDPVKALVSLLDQRRKEKKEKADC